MGVIIKNSTKLKVCNRKILINISVIILWHKEAVNLKAKTKYYKIILKLKKGWKIQIKETKRRWSALVERN